MALVCCLLMSLHANAYNKLSIPDVLMERGGSVDLPVNLENDDQIVALQFTLTVPDGFTLDVNSAQLTERSSGHLLRVKNVQGNDYLCMVYSVDNTEIIGNKGTVMHVKLKAPNNVNEGDVFPMMISDAVASDVNMNDLLSESSAGTITIADYPDLVPGNVTTDKQQYAPGDHIFVSWTVQNIGQLPTGGGWSERLSLITPDGAFKHLTTTSYDNILNSGQQVNRSASIVIPDVLGLDGNAVLQVEIVPNADTNEGVGYLGNNTATSGGINIGKKLYVKLNPDVVTEANGSVVKGLLTRSGDWSQDEVFMLTATSDGRISMPEQVTIPASQSSAYFYISLTANGIYDGLNAVVVRANGNGYDEAVDTLEIVDDVFPLLYLESSQRDISEGQSFVLNVHIDQAASHDVTLNLNCDHAALFSFPSQVTLPAGQTSIDINVSSIDDDVPYVNQTATFIVSAAGYQNDEAYVTVADNDIPKIELTLSPTTVSEGAGLTAINARLHRLGNANSKITIKLSDDSEGDIYYPMTSITLEAGVSTAQFTLGVIDNALLDGDRTINVTAAVYIASCSCQATGYENGAVTVPITIIDNDGPSLSLTSSLSTVLEGGTTVVTVTRNNNANSTLTVTLSSNAEDAIDYDHTVTIPAGESSVDVTINVRNNSVEGDSRIVELHADADGYALGTTWFMISDQTLPDAVIRSLTIDENEIYVGDEVKLNITLANEGASPLPSQTELSIYVDQATEATATIRLADALAAGDKITLTRSIVLPNVPGNHEIKVVANPSRTFAELSNTNNTVIINVELLPQFAVTITADKQAYAPGETVTFTGHAIGRLTSNQTVEIYVIGNGLRQTIEATTDATGKLTATWTPAPAQMGHFIAGACYPGENIKDAQTEFDVYGIGLADQYQVAQITVGEPYTGTIAVSNKGNLPQSNIAVTVVQGADNIETQFSTVSTLAGGENSTIAFTLNATAPTDNNADDLYNGWQKIKLKITDAQGVATDYSLYCYAAMPTASLEPSLTQIKTTVPKDGTHDIEFTLRNVGRGASGAIEFSLPPYITTLTPAKLPSLDFDESATVVLRFSAPEGMQLSQIMKGTLGINCANGTGLPLPYELELVSDAVGTLTIDVTDEYTYYTAEAPHVAGATVTIQHPVTSAIIAQGVTDSNGHYTVQLNEGYYNVTVTEASHNSAAKTVLVDPGREKTETIVISVSGVEITYEVVETEIEDVYEIVTTYTFETNVPVPVVTVEMPSSLNGEDLALGESIMFDVLITNHGLITAEDVELVLGEHNVFSFTAMETGSFDLAAHQSKIIKVVMTRVAESLDSKLRSVEVSDCYWDTETRYRWKCDKSTNWKYVVVQVPVKVLKCKTTGGGKDLPEWVPRPGGGSGPDFPPISIPSWWQKISDWLLKGSELDLSCDPCENAFLKKLVSCAVNFIPGKEFLTTLPSLISCADNIWSCFKKGGQMWDEENPQKRYCLTKLGTCISTAATSAAIAAGKQFPIIKIVTGVIDCINEFTSPCVSKIVLKGNGDTENTPMRGYPDYITVFQQNMIIVKDALTALVNVFTEYYGDDCWLNADPEQLNQFFSLLVESSEDDNAIDEAMIAEIIAVRPDNVSEQQALAFIERLNNTLDIASGNGSNNNSNQMNIERIDEQLSIIDEVTAQVTSLGYADLSDFIANEFEKVTEASQDGSNNVCSTITLEFKQKLTLTRQGFLGTLTVKNNHETNPIEDFQLHLEVRDPDGNIAGADKMEIHTESLNGFTGDMQLGSNWSLSSGATGVATVMYIPTDKAAPEHDVDYTFGGTVTFVDPYTGLTVSRELTPKTLTVRPAPQLYLDYFMQRDVLGDDPLTADVVEPSLPAEFALLINNRGAGDANNVKITTAQPQITENEKGLLIDMALLNGNDASLKMDEEYVNDFGTIAAGDHALAQWYLLSSLLGHFTSYNVEVNHVTGFNNPDLSLVKDAQIHELIHECVDLSNQVAFLVNEDVDANDTPDHMFYLNGESDLVASTASLQASQQGETELTLFLNNAELGWNYANAIDPTLGMVNIVKVVRQSDGFEVPLANVWLTDRTLRDGRDPLYENRIHIADHLTTNGNEVYVITVSPMVQPVLEVESIDGMETTSMNLQPVTAVTVHFNKPIDASTFTTADITLRHEGVKLDADKIVITPVNEHEFVLDLTELTTQSGYYVLTVATIGITDADGYNGRNGKMVGWIQSVDGTVAYKVNVSPADGGEVSSLAGALPAGSELSLTATPATGYEFAGWYIGNELVSDQNEWSFTLDAALTVIEARFSQIIYDVVVNVEPSEAGRVEGDGNGKYTYGDVLQMTAIPIKYYEFTGWTVNGEDAGNEPTLELTVTQNAVVVAHFEAIERVTIEYALKTGWNWVSFGVEDESMQDLNDALGALYNARTLRSKEAQATFTGMWMGDLKALNPEQSYKLQMASDGTCAITGEPITDATLTLVPGWNWLGYLPADELPITEALAFVPAEAGDVLKGQDSFVLYDGEQWLGDLTNMKPGLGYMYYSKNTKSFRFPDQHMSSHSHVNVDLNLGKTDSPWFYDPYKYANNMAINAVIANLTLSDGSWIGAFVGEECRGAAPITNGVFYLTVHGDLDGEGLTFKLYEPGMGSAELASQYIMEFADSYEPVASEPILLEGDISGLTELQGPGNIRIYPVPVTDRLYIDGLVDVDCLVIHAVSGVQMMKISNKDVTNGIDVSQLVDGMYVISIQAGNRNWSSTFIKK